AIDQQMPGALKVPSEERNAAERLFRNDPQLKRQRREDDGDVVDALVVRRDDIAARGIDVLEARDANADTGGLQDQPRPGARAPMAEVTIPIEKRREQRNRA